MYLFLVIAILSVHTQVWKIMIAMIPLWTLSTHTQVLVDNFPSFNSNRCYCQIRFMFFKYPYKKFNYPINYPKCPKHFTKHCELHCEQCDIPICVIYISSKNHLTHDVIDIFNSLESWKNSDMLNINDLKCVLKLGNWKWIRNLKYAATELRANLT